MTWREQQGKVTIGGRQLVGASFRGVPFLVDTSEYSGGRRTVVKEFPLRDQPEVEDLGRATRTFPVEGYVLGDDYLPQRDALIDALDNRSGPGQLLHPTYGALQVICTNLKVRESKREGGFAAFAIEFTEAAAQPRNPTVEPDAAELLDASATAALEASGADYAAVLQVEDLPGWVFDSIADVITSATEAVDQLVGPVLTEAQDLAALKSKLDALQVDALHLARRPLDLAAALDDLLLTFSDPFLLPRLLRLYAFMPPERPGGTTLNREVEISNFDAVLALVRRGIAIQAARLAPLADFDSYEAAVEVRDAVAEMLDEQLEVAGDEAFTPLQQLRADLVRSVPGEGSDLAHVVRYTPPAVVPSLVLAHRLYGDLEREEDLIGRNRIQNPAFIRGAEELEVLSGG